MAGYEFSSSTAHSDGFSGSIGGNAGISFGKDEAGPVEKAVPLALVALIALALLVYFSKRV